MNPAAPTRPILRWHGGKWLLAAWVIQHFPPHRVYVEPFGGAASVLLRKPRSYAEIYNDLDDDVVNLFRVLRDADKARQLVAALQVTPFARVEFEQSYHQVDEPVERARRLVVRSFMGFGSNAHNYQNKSGFRANSNRSGTTPARDWANYPGVLPLAVERLSGVIIEHRDACDVMRAHDGAETLHYVDPPYVWETRTKALPASGYYAHEMDEDDHTRLLAALRDLAGMVVLSGYPSALYDDALTGWMRVERTALADGARKRTEVLWINPAAADARDAATAQYCMFGGAAGEGAA